MNCSPINLQELYSRFYEDVVLFEKLGYVSEDITVTQHVFSDIMLCETKLINEMKKEIKSLRKSQRNLMKVYRKTAGKRY